MSNDANIEVEIIPENDDTVQLDESTNDSGENQDVSEEDNSLSDEKKNTSNFKKLSKAKKDAEKRAAEAEKRAEEAERRLANLDSEEDPLEEPVGSEPKGDLEKRLFFIENPEAKEYADAIEDELLEYPWLSYEKALALAKANNPKSESTQGIVAGKPRRTVRKKITDLSETEAQSLNNADYLKYLRSQGIQV